MGDSTYAEKIDEIYGDSGLLESAMKQPGIKEVMEVYNAWKVLDTTVQLHQQVLGMTKVVLLSNNSGPTVCEI